MYRALWSCSPSRHRAAWDRRDQFHLVLVASARARAMLQVTKLLSGLLIPSGTGLPLRYPAQLLSGVALCEQVSTR